MYNTYIYIRIYIYIYISKKLMQNCTPIPTVTHPDWLKLPRRHWFTR